MPTGQAISRCPFEDDSLCWIRLKHANRGTCFVKKAKEKNCLKPKTKKQITNEKKTATATTEAARQCERKIDLNPNAIGSARDVKYRRKCL